MTRQRVTTELVIRPSLQTYAVRLLLASILVLTLVGLQLRANWETSALYPLAGFWLAFFVVFAVLLTMFFRRGEIKLSEEQLTRWNLLGMRRSYALADIGGMARRDVDYPLTKAPTQYVIVYDKADRCLFKMDRPFWSPEDISRLHSSLGGSLKIERVSVWALADEFNDAVVWPALHPFLLIAVESVAVVGVIVGIVLVQDWLVNR